MKEKFVFIISNIHLPRCVNRVNEFVERGLNVEVYYFDRPLFKNETLKIKAPSHSLGELDSGRSAYLGRMYGQYKKVKSVVEKYKNTDAVIYLFGFDMAMVYHFCRSKLRYIFEESDLRHTYFRPSIVSKELERLDKKIIRKSLLTVFTSEGFNRYHFGKEVHDNIAFIPNRLNPAVADLDGSFSCEKRTDPQHIKIGFVGSIRFKTVYNFVDVFCRNYPKYEFHFYGSPVQGNIAELDKYDNCYFHGAFVSPNDLPEIYSNIDLVLSTYDTDYENALYAEPNKMYESMYFEVPIIVSAGTYVAEKVNELGIGFAVDAMDNDAIIQLVENLTIEKIEEKKIE